MRISVDFLSNDFTLLYIELPYYFENIVIRNKFKTVTKLYQIRYKAKMPVGHAVCDTSRLFTLKRLDRGFDSQLRHGCLCAIIMFVLFCV
jgi:hypothetical protein